jgi:hypothetical protein
MTGGASVTGGFATVGVAKAPFFEARLRRRLGAADVP